MDAPRPSLLRCVWCGFLTPSDYVHGHVQCVVCKHNLEPCCEGEQAPPDDPPHRGKPRAAAGRDLAGPRFP